LRKQDQRFAGVLKVSFLEAHQGPLLAHGGFPPP
jgi:hypothetical protein